MAAAVAREGPSPEDILDQYLAAVHDRQRLEQLRGTAPDPLSPAGRLIEGIFGFPTDAPRVRNLIRPDELPGELQPVLAAVFSLLDQRRVVSRKAVAEIIQRRGLTAARTEHYEIAPPEDWEPLAREIKDGRHKALTLDFALTLARDAANGVRTDDLRRFVREHLKAIETVSPAPPAFRAQKLEDFLKRQFPEREVLLRPWLTRGGLVMVHARRGIGKTWLIQTVAMALAAGSPVFGPYRGPKGRPLEMIWQASMPVRVLLVDGEMPGRDLRDRFAALALANGYDPRGNLEILAADTFDDPALPSLTRPEGQRAIEAAAEGMDVIIFDNVSTLFPGLDENDAQAWDPVQAWFLGFRRRGQTAILVHHAGKSGAQRGTSKREDALSTVIALREPDDFIPEEGARFRVTFEKSRGVLGSAVAPFEMALDPQSHRWEAYVPNDDVDAEIRDLSARGLSTRQIAKKLGLDQSTIARRLKRMTQGGEDE